MCYTLIRKAQLVWHSNTAVAVKRLSSTEKQSDETQTLEVRAPRIVDATMESTTKATLSFDVPAQGYSITSIRVATEGGVFVQTMSEGTVADGMGFLGAIAGGAKKKVDIGLLNAGSLTQVRFSLTVVLVDNDTQESVVVPIELTARSPDARMGDVLATDETTPKPSDVYTYALHFRAGNVTETPIKRVTITALEDARILAAGPFSNDRSVTFRPDRVDIKPGLVPADNDDGSTLSPGTDVRPVYLTVSGAPGGKVKLSFVTYDSTEAVVAEGDVDLGSPISSVRVDDSGRPVDDVSLFPPSPNPAANLATVLVRVDSPMSVTMRVIDLAGHTVLHPLVNQPLHTGDHGIVINAADLPSGVYQVLLTAPTGTLRVPLVISR